MKPKMFLTIMGLILVLFCYSFAQVPQMINYQGKLSKATGAPLDTTISMVFTVYADSNGTIPKWSETQTSIIVEKGVFNVLLGSVNLIPDSVFNSSIRYLGVKVGGDPEITPRKSMVSVPYAFHSGTADTAYFSMPDADWVINGDNIYNLNGNVGIGTTNPVAKLHVVDDEGMISQIATAHKNGGYRIVDSSGREVGEFKYHRDPEGVTINAPWAGNNLDLETQGIIRLFIRDDGNVGIGTTSPNEQLEITGNLRLPASTASVGVIKSGADRFIHNFGTNNFFAGVNAGNLTTSGVGGNTGVGWSALQALTAGDSNTAVGSDALFSNTTGSRNMAVGIGALRNNTTGWDNTAVGSVALFINTTGSNNMAVGLGALYYNTTGWDNTAVGHGALYHDTTGYRNTAVGPGALYYNTTGCYNTAVGPNALISNTTGMSNTAIGYQANVSVNSLTNATAIGANAVVAASNALVLGGTGVNAVNVGIGTTTPQGALDVTSITGALIVPRMTTAQRDALTAVNGMIIYNTTTNQFNFYEAGAWVTK